MFFLHPDDLTNLDIAGGQCYNQTIPQNVTFSYQNLPDGLSDTTSTNGSANHTSKSASWSLYGHESARSHYVVAASTAMLAALWTFL